MLLVLQPARETLKVAWVSFDEDNSNQKKSYERKDLSVI